MGARLPEAPRREEPPAGPGGQRTGEAQARPQRPSLSCSQAYADFGCFFLSFDFVFFQLQNHEREIVFRFYLPASPCLGALLSAQSAPSSGLRMKRKPCESTWLVWLRGSRGVAGVWLGLVGVRVRVRVFG